MELRHLRYFVAVAEEENVTHAAARLHVAQPPLSRQIRDLERELGVSLFARSARGVRLTDVGEAFLDEARAVLQRLDDAVERVAAVARGKRGRVRVGHASPTMEILRRALRSFSRTHPHVSVDLREMSSLGMLRALRQRQLDVALTVAIAPRDFEGLAVEDLGAYAVRVALSKTHRLARLREVPLGELVREPILSFTRREYPEAHAGVLEILAPVTRSPNIVEEYDSLTSLVAAVEAGRGVALVFQSMALVLGQRLALRALKPAPPLAAIAMAYRTDGVGAAAAAFIAATRAARPKRAPSGPILTTPGDGR